MAGVNINTLGRCITDGRGVCRTSLECCDCASAAELGQGKRLKWRQMHAGCGNSFADSVADGRDVFVCFGPWLLDAT